jgi:hypothetical protein
MKTKFSRFRVVALAITLALTMAALAPTPAAADQVAMVESGWQCEDGCWAWDEQNGCTQEVTCCAHTSGDWFCIMW